MLHYYKIALLQDIGSRTTPQKSDSRPASALCSKYYILRVCRVCGLLFTILLRQICHENRR